jgi:hypothetical protein
MGSQVSDTARQDLVRRIERLVKALERMRRQPNRREAYHALVALECLDGEHYEEGERAMGRAEQVTALPPAVATLPGIHETMTTQQLTGRLDRIVSRAD